jgi:hypothetical protein
VSLIGLALPTLTPGLLLVEIVVLLVLGGILAAFIAGVSPRQVVSLSQGRRFVVLDRERAAAADLGIPARAWFTMRVALIVVALLVGLLSGTVVLTLGLLLAAVLGVPWAFSGRAMKRRIERDRAMVNWITDLKEAMQTTGQGLDSSIRDAAQRPAPAHLETVLDPLRDPGSIIDNLAAVADRARSDTIRQALASVIFSRTRDVDILIAQIDTVILPVSRQRIMVEEEAMGTLTQQRAVAMVMLGIYAAILATIFSTQSLAAFYRGLEGQLLLAGVLAFYTFVVWLMGRIVRTPKWTEFDMAQVVRLEAQLRLF